MAIDPTDPGQHRHRLAPVRHDRVGLPAGGHGLQPRRRRDLDLPRRAPARPVPQRPGARRRHAGQLLLLQPELGDHGASIRLHRQGRQLGGPDLRAGRRQELARRSTSPAASATDTSTRCGTRSSPAATPGTDFTRSTDGTVSLRGPLRAAAAPQVGHATTSVPTASCTSSAPRSTSRAHLILRSDNADDALATPDLRPGSRASTSAAPPAVAARPTRAACSGQVWVAVDRSSGADAAATSTCWARSTRQARTPSTSTSSAARTADRPGPLRCGSTTIPRPTGPTSGSARCRSRPTAGSTSSGTTRATAARPISELYYAYSTDAGVTFSAGLPVSPPFDSTRGPSRSRTRSATTTTWSRTTSARRWPTRRRSTASRTSTSCGSGTATATARTTRLTSAMMTSADVNSNGIPDECEPDCNGNGVPDDVRHLRRRSVTTATATRSPTSATSPPEPATTATATACSTSATSRSTSSPDQGFVVGAADDTATPASGSGSIPVGTAAQPEDDHTPGPGTTCFVTGGEHGDVAGRRKNDAVLPRPGPLRLRRSPARLLALVLEQHQRRSRRRQVHHRRLERRGPELDQRRERRPDGRRHRRRLVLPRLPGVRPADPDGRRHAAVRGRRLPRRRRSSRRRSTTSC